VYDMYPAWDESAPGQDARQKASKDPSKDASSGNSAPPARVEHIRTPRRRAARPGTSPALKAVQASLDRRDNGGDAIGAVTGTTATGTTGTGTTGTGTALNRVASRAPASATRQ
jgi:hypothetical protein